MKHNYRQEIIVCEEKEKKNKKGDGNMRSNAPVIIELRKEDFCTNAGI